MSNINIRFYVMLRINTTSNTFIAHGDLDNYQSIAYDLGISTRNHIAHDLEILKFLLIWA